MPAEAVHLSALHDTIPALPAAWQRLAATGPTHKAARIGAIFVDMAYFESFATAVFNYLIKRPQQPSPWGERFHHRTPIRLGLTLAEAGAALRRQPSRREEGEFLLALGLGYFSHVAVDRALHPLVNTLARERAQRLGRTLGEQHHEVEKFQSILFHEQRFGTDFMGRPLLGEYIGMDLSLLHRPGPIAQAVQAALAETHGEAPGLERYRNWCRGYAHYVRLIASPLGRTIAPERDKRRERPRLFDAVNFNERFGAAVSASQRTVTTLCDYLDGGAFDEAARTAFYRLVPEGTLDPDPGRPEGQPDVSRPTERAQVMVMPPSTTSV